MLDKLCHFIVKFRRQIGIFFLFLVVISIILFTKVNINYDLSIYIPEDMPSRTALELAKKEFGMQSTARVMINNISLIEAKEYKDKIEAIDGIYKVIWISDDIDVYVPESFLDEEEISKYYKDGSALYDLMFEEDDYSDLTYKAVDELQKVLPQDANLSGSAIDNKSSRDHLNSEMITIMLFLVPLTIIILLSTTDSYFSSLIFVVVIGVSIILNMGSNIIFDSISFITFSISAALQFAVSMDYSVFMLHQFEYEKKKYSDEEEAMKKAVKHASLSIFSSSLTTIAGFVALAFMNFGIGKDIGLVFAKGIIFSLLCVILLMPYLILTFNKQIENTKHKRLLPSFDRFSRATLKIGPLLIILSLLIIIPSYVAQKNNDFTYGTNSFGAGPGTKGYIDEQEIIKKFGRSNPIMFIVPNKNYYTEKKLVKEYESLDTVDKVLTLVNQVPEGVPYDFIDKEIYDKFQNEKYTRIIVYVKTSSESELAYDTLNKVKDITSKYYGNDYYYTGTIPVTIDMKDSIQSDYNVVNMISILAIMIILVFTFKSIIIPIILVLVIEAGIFINMGIPFFMDDSLNFIGYLIVSSIELGATIDYAILVTNNYLKYRRHYNKKMAAMNSIKESIISVLTSGLILISAGYIIKYNSSMKAVSDIGELVGRGALISVILVVAVLPQFLSLFDGLITRKMNTIEKNPANANKTDNEENNETGDNKTDSNAKNNKKEKLDKKENSDKKEKTEKRDNINKAENTDKNNKKEKAKIKPREYVKNRYKKYEAWKARNREIFLDKVTQRAEDLKKENEEQLKSIENSENKEADKTKNYETNKKEVGEMHDSHKSNK